MPSGIHSSMRVPPHDDEMKPTGTCSESCNMRAKKYAAAETGFSEVESTRCQPSVGSTSLFRSGLT